MLGGIAAATWLGAQVAGGARARQRADHLLLTAVLANALPHVGKHLVRRERPDRMVAPWCLWIQALSRAILSAR